MGNKSSLRVDYAELNKSCEHIEQVRSGTVKADPDPPPRPSMTTDDAKTSLDPNSPDDEYSWDSGRSTTATMDTPLRSARSLPNVNEEQPEATVNQLVLSRPRERCSTISQPIRIPKAPKSSLTVENVEGCAMKKHPQPIIRRRRVSSSGHSDSRPVDLIPCEDIVIHLDALQSPGTSASESLYVARGATHLFVPKERAHSRRIGSAPPDFHFLPLQGEKIPHSYVRCRHYSAGFDDYLSPPSTSTNATRKVQRPTRGQTLTAFLEGFSSSDSELERENAHFSISQAVICVLEQLKWRNQLRQSHGITLDHESGMSTSSQDNPWSTFVCSDNENDDDDEPNENSIDSELMVSGSDVAPAGPLKWARESSSAEGLGLCLLSKFRDLPQSSDFLWFDDCGSYAGGDRTDIWSRGHLCRGTNDWAPPRPQIIFTRKGVQCNSRKKTLQDQHYRCRGCGSHVSVEYSSKFRLCGYTGHYYCTSCHRHQVSVIPARVLDDWDFKLYPVAVGAYRLLEEIWYSPLFHLPTINPHLLNQVPALASAKRLRMLLRLAKDHVNACRFFQQEDSDPFLNMPDYFTVELDLWSMADLMAVKKGSFHDVIRFVKQCDEHVKQCELCLARGYLCELCHSGDIVFPWHSRIIRCPDCGSCVHERCWTNAGQCSKCNRIRLRK